MAKYLVHGFMVGLVFLAYLLSGLLTQALAGVIDGKTFRVALGGILVLSVIAFAVAFALIRAFRGKAPAGRTVRPVTRQALKVLTAAMLGAAGLGIWLSMNGVRKHDNDTARQAAAFSPQQVCRATIATLMGRDPAIIEVDRTEAGIVHVTYIRPGDGTSWSQRCKFEGPKVIWATATGRWRIHPDEEVNTFSSTANSLTIYRAFSDNSASSKTFTREQLTK